MIDLTRDETVMEVCEDCFFEHLYPGENPPSEGSVADLWTYENRGDWVPGIPYGFGSCNHDPDDLSDVDDAVHKESCEMTEFGTNICPACHTSLAGHRFAMTYIGD